MTTEITEFWRRTPASALRERGARGPGPAARAPRESSLEVDNLKRKHYLVADSISIWADEQVPLLTTREFKINGMVVASVPLMLTCRVYSGTQLLECA